MEVFEQEIREIAKELAVSEEIAANVWYLRTRSRHTPELEADLVNRLMRGELINLNEFGVTFHTHKRMRSLLKDLEGKWQYETSHAP